MKECSLLKDGGLGVVTMGVKTFPSAHLAIGSNEMLEIDEISIDPDFVGNIAGEKERNEVVLYRQKLEWTTGNLFRNELHSTKQFRRWCIGVRKASG